MVAIFWDTVDIMVDMVTDMEDGLTTDMDTMDILTDMGMVIGDVRRGVLNL